MSDNKINGSNPNRPDYTLQSFDEAAQTNVGGHGGFRICPDELLKPCTYPNERTFYEETEGTPLEAVRPKFFGVRVQDGKEYLAMENCTKGFVHPCILDMKMGFQTWHAECSEEKKQKHMRQDASNTTGKYGFRFCGMKVFDPVANAMRKYHTQYGWGATTDAAMRECLLTFFGPVVGQLDTFVTRLRAVKAAMTGSRWHLVASSILFIYDADAASVTPPRAVMIDFAHSQRTDTDDAGYIKGVENLIGFLESLSPLRQ